MEDRIAKARRFRAQSGPPGISQLPSTNKPNGRYESAGGYTSVHGDATVPAAHEDG
jgi:hypothetical protein